MKGFSVCITSSARKSAKHLPLSIRKDAVRFCAEFIALHPFDSGKLAPPLDECRSFHFKADGVHYRIAYLVIKKEKRIDVVLIATRENFYDKLKRTLRK